jgi:putative effector of murein hydrolase
VPSCFSGYRPPKRRPPLNSLWQELRALPIAWTAVTVLIFAAAQYIFRRSGRPALMNPVLLSVTALCLVLVATGTDYSTYFRGAMPIHLMLGPATVALAIPLHQNAGRVRAAALPVAGALLAGSLTAILVAVGIAFAFGLNETTLLSIAPKSATTPVAIGISEGIGGSATLTVVAVVLTGIGGAVIALPLLKLIRVTDWKAKGFAMGLSAHGIGTAAAMDQDESGGAFASLGMGMNALLTALLVPLLVALWRYFS